MELTVKLDFHCDGMDEENIEEVKKTLEAVFESGAESTCTELRLLSIKK